MAEEQLTTGKSLPRRVFTEADFCLAFGFGSGLAPKMPGTVGTLAGVLLFYPLSKLHPFLYASVVLIAVVAGIYICGRVASRLGEKDPGGIVWDEITGVWIALFMVPSGWYWLLGGFVAFRGFDIFKPWPVNWLDRELTGGFGIMLDDVAAGIYTLVLLQGLNFIVNTV